MLKSLLKSSRSKPKAEAPEPPLETPEALRGRVAEFLGNRDGADAREVAEALHATPYVVEDVLDAMADERLVYKDTSFEPAHYLLKGGGAK